MHLRFTEQELATLIEMVSLAATVASWNQKESADQQIIGFEELESRILEKASQFGHGEKIEFDEETRRFRMKAEAAEKLFFHECYEEFRNESFWDELAVRLADRDMARAMGLRAWEELDDETRSKKSAALEKRYLDEFLKNGIERIVVMAPPGEG